jgi:hypothetical protein
LDFIRQINDDDGYVPWSHLNYTMSVCQKVQVAYESLTDRINVLM